MSYLSHDMHPVHNKVSMWTVGMWYPPSPLNSSCLHLMWIASFMLHLKTRGWGWGCGEGLIIIQMTGMLLVLLRCTNDGFLSHLGCSGKSSHILAVKVSFRVACKEIEKKNDIILFRWKSIGKEITVATIRVCDIIIKIMVDVPCLLFKSGIL